MGKGDQILRLFENGSHCYLKQSQFAALSQMSVDWASPLYMFKKHRNTPEEMASLWDTFINAYCLNLLPLEGFCATSLRSRRHV